MSSALCDFVQVGFVHFLSKLRKQVGQHLQFAMLLIVRTGGASPNQMGPVVQASDECEGDVVPRIAIGSDSVPVPIDHRGETLVWLEELSLQLRSQILEEPRTQISLRRSHICPKVSLSTMALT